MHLKQMGITLPPIEDQKAIAHILGTLDDKIELNQKMNQTLEEIAKAIFKSWFVDFDPVRAKAAGRPTGLSPDISDLFPDELVDSEIGEIPKGWNVGCISDFACLNKKAVNPSQSEEVYEHFSIPAFDSGQSPVLDMGTDIKSNKTLVVEGSLLVSKLNPNTPRVWLPNPKDLYEQICSTEFMVFTATDCSNIAFLWGLFTSSVVASRMEAMVTGTSKSHQRVKPNDVSNIAMVRPDARIIEIYGDLVVSMLNRTLVGKSQSNVVVGLRDALLPKLISGELRIPDAEKFLEEAGI
jgi:type I restriction enzyme S subunit